MKKILLLVCACVFFSDQVNAANCVAGKEFSGKNGHVYCSSNNKMNWWSAATWCEAQGRHLASMEELCPDTGEGLNNAWDGSTGNKCANLTGVGSGQGWSSLAEGTSGAFNVGLQAGHVGTSSRTRTDGNVAYCY